VSDSQGRLLLAIAVWSFARFYCFLFYVIEHYVDPGFRFAGLWSFVRYLMRRRRAGPAKEAPSPMPESEATDGRPADQNR
jgi:hypothetical protein